MKSRLMKDLKLTTSVLAIILMMFTAGIGYYASTVAEEKPEPSGDIVIAGDWKQASVRGYNNERFVNETNPKNDFRLEPTEDETVFIGHARGATFACILMDGHLMWSYEVSVGKYTAIVNLMPGCLVVNEIFVSKLNTDERYVSISVYTASGQIPEWFSYWDIGRIQQEWTGATAFSLYHKEDEQEQGYMNLQGKRFYVKSVDGSLFLAEMQLMEGTTTVTRPIQGIVISCTDEGLLALVTDSHGDNWIMECNNELLIMRAVFQSKVQEILDRWVSIERSYMIEGDSYISSPITGVFHTGDQWKITDKKIIHMDGTVEPFDPQTLVIPFVTMTDTKGAAFICNDIDMGLPVHINLVGYTAKAYEDPGRHWIFADVTYGDQSTTGYGKYDENAHTIKFEFYVTLNGVTNLYYYTFVKQ
ncbi:MAG: hypothetical protein MJZ38_01085 [archaeon]|nr:hypothetical protein [archaeon]